MLSFKEINEKFVRRIMVSGKKYKAEKIYADCRIKLDLDVRSDNNSGDIIPKALSNVAPILEVRSVRVAGSTYKIPFPINKKRQYSLGVSWIVKSARSRSERGMASRLAGELLDASKGVGASIRKRNELHKTAEANRAFAHYRWG
jgi:small subunit ribosomal protein S7